MFCQVFKLDKYFNQTQVYFNFFDGLFLLEEESKQQILEKLRIPSSSYRTQRLKEKTSKYNINILLKYFKYNEIKSGQITEYEVLFSRIYYCCYFKQKDRLIEQLQCLNSKIVENNILKPLLILFRVFIYTNLENRDSLTKKLVENDIEYLKLFYNKKYFKDDFEYLYLVILYYFDILDVKALKYIDNLSISYPKLSWLYYFYKASKAYLKEDDATALINYEYVLNEFKITNNLERYLLTATNVAYLYNILGQYHLSYNITSQVIEYVFSEINAQNRIENMLLHYLFSNLMLGRYEEIINFVDIVIFDYRYLNDLSAIICVIAADKIGKIDRFDQLLNMTFEDKNFEIIKHYLKSKDKTVLAKLVNYPYIDIMIKNSIL